MGTHLPKDPERIRALISREIEEIRNDIENLRLAAEASRSEVPTTVDGTTDPTSSARQNHHAYIME